MADINPPGQQRGHPRRLIASAPTIPEEYEYARHA
jgi:hypothetical protein